MRKCFLLFVFLLLAVVAFKVSSNDTEEKLEKPSVELHADTENVDLAAN